MARTASKKTAKKKTGKRPPRSRGQPAGQKIAEGPNLEDVSQLIRLMVQNELTEIKIANGKVEIHLKRGVGGGVSAEGTFGPAAAAQPAAAVEPPKAEAPEPAEEPPAEELLEVRSPMVGTFYAAASPDSDPYVTIGSGVTEETIVCIVEAMKVMNEIKAECAGTVAEICVRNAQPVEYGQTLFRVKPY